MKLNNFYDFVNHLQLRQVELLNYIFKRHFGDIVPFMKNRKIQTQITSEWFPLFQQTCACEEVTLFSNNFLRDLAKTMMCLRDMPSITENFKRS